MKNVLIIILFIFTSVVFAQKKCKYESNIIDVTTKDTIKVAEKLRIWKAFNDVATVQFSKKAGVYSLTIECVIFLKRASTYEGCELVFLLENGREIILKKGKMSYTITKEQISEMRTSKIVKILYQFGTNTENTKSYEREVDKKWAENIIKTINCIY